MQKKSGLRNFCCLVFIFLGRLNSSEATALDKSKPTSVKIKSEKVSALETYLENYRKNNGLPGLILSYTNDKTFSPRGVAVGSTPQAAGKNRLLTAVDLVPVGSISKSFTDVLLMRRIENPQSGYKFESTLEELLPDLRMHNSFKKVTLSMLMTHRGGFPNETPLPKIPYVGKNRIELLKAIIEQAPENTPGKQIYSTYGLVGIAAIMEIREKKSWEQLITEEVLKPLELKSCKFLGYAESRDSPQQAALPYLSSLDFQNILWGHIGTSGNFRPLNPNLVKTYYDPLWNPGAGIYCTLPDLNKFLLMQVSGKLGIKTSKILNLDTSYSALFTVPSGSKWAYTQGAWSLNTKASKLTSAWTYGANGGTFLESAWFPESSLLISALSNAFSPEGDAFWLDKLVDDLSERLPTLIDGDK